jgi:hypothetical protein
MYDICRDLVDGLEEGEEFWIVTDKVVFIKHEQIGKVRVFCGTQPCTFPTVTK